MFRDHTAPVILHSKSFVLTASTTDDHVPVQSSGAVIVNYFSPAVQIGHYAASSRLGEADFHKNELRPVDSYRKTNTTTVERL